MITPRLRVAAQGKPLRIWNELRSGTAWARVSFTDRAMDAVAIFSWLLQPYWKGALTREVDVEA